MATNSVAGNRLLVIALAVVAAMLTPIAGAASAAPASPTPDFGPNVTIFDPSMSTGEIEATINEIWEQQRNAEMVSDRYSLLFMPGEYGTNEDPLQVAVGYYTEVAGLGASPADVRINGKVEVFNRCFDASGNPTDDGAGASSVARIHGLWLPEDTPRGPAGCRIPAQLTVYLCRLVAFNPASARQEAIRVCCEDPGDVAISSCLELD